MGAQDRACCAAGEPKRCEVRTVGVWRRWRPVSVSHCELVSYLLVVPTVLTLLRAEPRERSSLGQEVGPGRECGGVPARCHVPGAERLAPCVPGTRTVRIVFREAVLTAVRNRGLFVAC